VNTLDILFHNDVNETQTIPYSRRIMSKRVTSFFRHLSPCHSAQDNTATCLRRCWSGCELFATPYKIWPAWNSNYRPPEEEAHALTVRPSW